MDDPASSGLLLFANEMSSDPSTLLFILLKIFLVFLLVFANGFFVAAEFAFVAVRRSRIETLANEGNTGARRLLKILDNLNAYLSASQLGITLTSLVLGWVGEPVVSEILAGPLQFLPEAARHPVSFFI